MNVSYHPDVINCKQLSFLADILPDLFCLSDSDLYCLFGESLSPDTWDEKGEHFKGDKQ